MKKYFLPTKIIFGEKTYTGLFKELEEAGVKKPLLVCGNHFLSSLKYRDFEEKAPVFEVFTSVEPNPSTATVDSAANALNSHGCDAVVGVGGGSVLDVSKVVACMKNYGKGCESLYGKISLRPSNRVPFFAVPTTSGSGSEVTRYSVLTLPGGAKRTLRNGKFYAKVAIVDPELTFSAPPGVTAAAGIDAFCQAVESYWAKSATPQTQAFSRESIGLSYHSLFKAVKDPDKQARHNMSLASLRAGQAFSNTGTTACHTVSYAFTKHFGLVHGFAVAITLPWFLQFYSEAGGKTSQKCLEVCEMLGAKSVDEGMQKITELLSSIGAPTLLRDIGCRREDFPKIIEMCLEERPQNPRKHSSGDLERMLNGLY